MFAHFWERHFEPDIYKNPTQASIKNYLNSYDSKDELYKNYQLLQAVKQGHLGTVKSLLAEGHFDINVPLSGNVTPLLAATYEVKHGSPNAEAILELILEQNPCLQPDSSCVESLDLKKHRTETVSTDPLGNILLIEDSDKRAKWYQRFLEAGLDFGRTIGLSDGVDWDAYYLLNEEREEYHTGLFYYLYFHHMDLIRMTLLHYLGKAAELIKHKDDFEYVSKWRADTFKPFFEADKAGFVALCEKFGCPTESYKELYEQWKPETSKGTMEKFIYENSAPVKDADLNP